MSTDGDKRGSLWYWIAGGCGVVVLLGGVGTCLGPMLFSMWWTNLLGGGGFTAPYAPAGPVATAPHGLELPQAPGPVMPWTASGPALAKRRVVATVASATGVAVTGGTLVVAPGNEIFVDITKLSEGEPCRAHIEIGGTPVYGGGAEGYVECTVYDGVPILANDYAESSEDGNPALSVDQGAGTFRVWDTSLLGGFDVSGTIVRVEEIQ